MREIASPLDGIRSPFGVRSSVSPLAIYAVLGFKPELVLDFDDEKYFANSAATTFSDAITHSASSNATMVDSDGLLKWRPHNLVRRSEEFDDDASWVKFRSAITENATISPDGATTADKLVPTASLSGGFVYNTVVIGIVGQVSTASVYVKAAELGFAFVALNNRASSTASGACINLSTGALTNQGANGTYSVTDAGNGWWKISCTSTATITNNYLEISPLAVAGSYGSYTGDGTSGIYIWGAHLYRSDLGGMVNNPDRGDSYVPTTSSARYLPRRGHHIYNGTSWVNEGLLVESEARTNLIAGSNDFLPANNYWQEYVSSNRVSVTAAQAVGPDGEMSMSLLTDALAAAASHGITTTYDQTSVTFPNNTPFTVSCHFKNLDRRYVTFAGSGLSSSNWFAATIDLLDGTVTQTGAGATGTYLGSAVEDLSNGIYRVSVTGQVADSAISASIWVFLSDTPTPTYGGYGQSSHDGANLGVYIYGAQLEAGSTPSSYIPTSGATVTRAAETATEPDTVTPYNATAMSGASSLLLNYADTGSATEQTVFDWRADANNRITVTLDTAGANTGRVTLTVVNGGSSVSVSSTNQVTPGLSVAARVAWRVTTSEINIALNGTAATAVSNTAGVPDLSAASATLGGMAVRNLERGWAADITDAGLEAATVTRPLIFGVPTISGNENQGATLTASSAPVVIGTPTPTTTWQWKRDGSPISGATSSTYTLTGDDVGSTITVTQTETNVAGSASATSAATGTIVAVPAGAIAQRDGAYILDRAGNYIEVRA